jgi:hypothetical protein
LKQESIALAIAGKCCCAWNSQDRWAPLFANTNTALNFNRY